MRQRRLVAVAALAVPLLVVSVQPAAAAPGQAAVLAAGSAGPATVTVCPSCAVRTPQQGLAQLPPGGTLRVEAGRYRGPLVINRTAHLVGAGDPIIDGGEAGTVVTLAAADSSLEGFTVQGSGISLDAEDTGVLVTGARATVRGNRVRDVLFGIYVRGSNGSRVLDNTVTGKPLPVGERGDGLRVWNSDGIALEGNTVRGVRDDLVQFSSNCVISGNHLVDDRYGLHFMFSDHCRVTGNVGENNSVGAFLMYSVGLVFSGNTFRGSRGPSGYGAAVWGCDSVTGGDNLLLDNRIGLALFNTPHDPSITDYFQGNVIAYNDVGLSIESTVSGDVVSGNDFIDNLQQVQAQGQSTLTGVTWTQHGRGNYWSDYSGYDANGDGVGGTPYRPAGTFESLAANNPNFQLLFLSPVAKALDWAAAAFPVFAAQVLFADPAPLTAPVRTSVSPPTSGVGVPLLAGTAILLLLGAVLVLLGVRMNPGRRGTADRADRARLVARPPVRADRPGDLPGGSVIKVTGLHKAYGGTVIVDDLSFEVAPGEILALWGDNGAGKTTVLRSLLGLVLYQGEVCIGGWSARTHRRQALAELGHVSQEPAFHGDLTVAETMTFYGRLRGAGDDEQVAALETAGLRQATGKRVAALSGGMRRKLAVAVALLGAPRVLLLDEPTANLDRHSRRDLITLLRELKAAGVAMILASHQPDEVAELADRVLRLEAGRAATEVDVNWYAGTATAGHLALMVPEPRRDEAARVLLDAGIPTLDAALPGADALMERTT